MGGLAVGPSRGVGCSVGEGGGSGLYSRDSAGSRIGGCLIRGGDLAVTDPGVPCELCCISTVNMPHDPRHG